MAVPTHPTTWSRLCGRHPARSFQLWTALRALGLDIVPRGGRGLVPLITAGSPTGALATIETDGGGKPIIVTTAPVPRQGADSAEWCRVALRARPGRERTLTPGPTLEEKVAGQGLDTLLPEEVRHCKAWLEADRALGLTLLLGPLGKWALDRTFGRRIDQGLLDADGKLTDAGWWCLAYKAGQGMGDVELLRWRLLTGMHDRLAPVSGRLTRRRHLQRTQQLVLMLMEERGWVPLGVELSATAQPILRYRYMRPDALMVRPPSTLVWVELLRRREARLRYGTQSGRSSSGERYRRMREEVLPFLAAVLGRPVELYLRQPGGDEHLRWEAPAGRQLDLFSDSVGARRS